MALFRKLGPNGYRGRLLETFFRGHKLHFFSRWPQNGLESDWLRILHYKRAEEKPLPWGLIIFLLNGTIQWLFIGPSWVVEITIIQSSFIGPSTGHLHYDTNIGGRTYIHPEMWMPLPLGRQYRLRGKKGCLRGLLGPFKVFPLEL